MAEVWRSDRVLETGKVDEVFSGETAKSNEKSHSRDMLAALTSPLLCEDESCK